MDNRSGLTHYITDVKQVREYWPSFLGLGILLILLGIASISFATVTTVFSVFIFGLLLIAGGIVQIIESFMVDKWSGFFLSLLLSVLYLVTGFLCVFRPAVSAVSLTLLIAAFCLIGGLFRIIAAPIMRFNHWGWVFFNGIVTFILGCLILADWPLSGLWIIGLFIGIDLLMVGLTWVFLALTARKAIS